MHNTHCCGHAFSFYIPSIDHTPDKLTHTRLEKRNKFINILLT